MPRPLLLATLNFPPAAGGIEQLCAELARALAALEVPVHVLAPSQPGDAEHDAALPYPVTRYRGGALRHVQLARALLPLVRSTPSTVLFAQWTGASALVLREALGRRGTRLSTLAHGKELMTPARGHRASRAFAGYRRAVLSRMSPVIAVSEHTAALARAAGARQVRVIHPGVDSERYSPAAAAAYSRAELLDDAGGDAEGPLVLSVGRLVPRKGVDTVIAALPELIRDHPRLRYVVGGDGPDRARLTELVERHGVGAHVRFAGRVDAARLPALYAAADVLVMASRELPGDADVEGFGLALLEAQASGTPVVAAQSGGMPDALLPDRTGLLVQPGDSHALAAALHVLLSDGSRRRAMGEAARAHAVSQSWRAMALAVAQTLQLNEG